MLVDVTQPIKAINGEPLKDVGENGEAVDATLKMVIVNALCAPVPKEQKGMDKTALLNLSLKVYNAEKEVSLDEKEITLIKDRAEQAFPSPVVVGRINELLKV